MELYVVRHGQTDANKNGIVQGWLDTPLNERGLAQAQEAAEAFDVSVDMIVSSDLRRCIQTARAFRTRMPDVPYSQDRRLRERGFGDAQGTQTDTYDWKTFWASRDSVSIPNAETLDDFEGRVRDFLDDARMLGGKALVITHNGVINRMRALTSGDDGYVPYGNSNVTRFDIS